MAFHQKQNTFGKTTFTSFCYSDTVWDNHFHRDFEIVYVISGSLECTIGTKTGILNAGELAMCLPYEIHSYIPSKNTKYHVWGFADSYVRTFAAAVSGKTADTFKFRCSDEVLRYVFSLLSVGCKPSVYTLKSCLYALCGEYLKCVKLCGLDKKSAKAAEIIFFIENNCKNSISLADAANHLGYDYHYISRYFKKTFNMTFVDFLGSCRTQAAVSLLEETDKRITEIAFDSGFQSVRSFNDCFKKYMGVNPTDYRKSLPIR